MRAGEGRDEPGDATRILERHEMTGARQHRDRGVRDHCGESRDGFRLHGRHTIRQLAVHQAAERFCALTSPELHHLTIVQLGVDQTAIRTVGRQPGRSRSIVKLRSPARDPYA